MHELSLARGLLDVVAAAAHQHEAHRVTQVRVRIGSLAHVDPEALRLAFAAASQGSIAQGALLSLERPSGRAFCVPCGEEFDVKDRAAPCPRCDRHQWLLLHGEEMRVVDVEVEP
mgnify:FL=1